MLRGRQRRVRRHTLRRRNLSMSCHPLPLLRPRLPRLRQPQARCLRRGHPAELLRLIVKRSLLLLQRPPSARPLRGYHRNLPRRDRFKRHIHRHLHQPHRCIQPASGDTARGLPQPPRLTTSIQGLRLGRRTP